MGAAVRNASSAKLRLAHPQQRYSLLQEKDSPRDTSLGKRLGCLLDVGDGIKRLLRFQQLVQGYRLAQEEPWTIQLRRKINLRFFEGLHRLPMFAQLLQGTSAKEICIRQQSMIGG